MANENEVNDQIEDVIPLPDFKPELADDGVTDKTDWKAKAEEARQIADKNIGIAKRNKTRAERARAAAGEPKPNANPAKGNDATPKPGEFDYGQKAYLVANGVKGADEIVLVSEVVKATGQTLDQVLESPHFQGQLKDLRDKRAAKEAIPSGHNRPANAAIDSVEYWIAKNELPPKGQTELRRKVIDARVKKETQTNVFAPQSVVQ